MAENSKIEWCDHTINFWQGCQKISPGCENCYAERISKRWGKDIWGPGKAREDHRAGAIKLARKLNRQAEKKGVRYRVFCNSMSDWLDPEVPIDWLADMLDVIRTTPHLDWLLLTKRPENFARRLYGADDEGGAFECLRQSGNSSLPGSRGYEMLEWIGDWANGRPPHNVWIGATVEDQARADARIPELLKVPAKVRFLSCEPLLGPLDLDFGAPKWRTAESYHSTIDWVICGGESGSNARPMSSIWERSLRLQCAEAGIPYFFKQWGKWRPISRWGGPPWPPFDHVYISGEDGQLIAFGEWLEIRRRGEKWAHESQYGEHVSFSSHRKELAGHNGDFDGDHKQFPKVS